LHALQLFFFPDIYITKNVDQYIKDKGLEPSPTISIVCIAMGGMENQTIHATVCIYGATTHSIWKAANARTTRVFSGND